MHAFRWLALAVVLVGTSACKVNIEADVSLKELFSGTSPGITGTLQAHVDSCEDKKDVADARSEVEDVFKDASYVNCIGSSFGDYLEYRLPMVFDRTNDGKFASESHINIYSLGHHAMGLYLPRALEAKLRSTESMGSSIDISTTLTVTNDTGKSQMLGLHSVYVNGHAITSYTSEIENGTELEIRLSNVLIDVIREQGMGTFITREK